MAKCDGQTNQLFSVKAGRLVSVQDRLPGGLCLTARADRPPAIGKLQIWAKPQPDNATAVLVLTNGDLNGTVRVNFTEVGLHSQGRDVAVRDIWALRNVGIFKAGFDVNLDELGQHDSRFFILVPKVANGKPSVVI